MLGCPRLCTAVVVFTFALSTLGSVVVTVTAVHSPGAFRLAGTAVLGRPRLCTAVVTPRLCSAVVVLTFAFSSLGSVVVTVTAVHSPGAFRLAGTAVVGRPVCAPR